MNCRLGDVIQLQHGNTWQESACQGGTIPVYGSDGIVGLHTQSLVNGPGIIVGRKGMVGSVFWSSEAFFPTDTVFFVEPISSQIQLRFAYYMLKAMKLSRLNYDVIVPELNREVILRQTIRLPTLHEQAKISETLSSYDDLIENNRRRIGLLEKAAQLIYREWFVNFRYPGHEQDSITNGLPRGWQRQALGKIAAIKEGKNIAEEAIEKGEVSVMAGGPNPACFHNTANATGPIITISTSDAHAGHVNLYHSDIWASDCSYLSITENPEIWFLYLTLKHHQAEITGIQQSAEEPHVYPKDVVCLKLNFPAASIRKQFHEKVEANFQLIANLEAQNQKLAQARDLLLPQLMNGEIST